MLHRAPHLAGSQHRAGRPLLLAASMVAICVLASHSRADVLRILRDDQEAAQARVDLIQQARVEIDAAYFAVRDDNLALAFLALLRDASRRGVKVRLIVDAMYNDIPGSVQAHLISEGVEIREYHPIHVRRPLEINRRMHDKALIADACAMIVGSRNLDHRHFGLAEQNYADCDAYVRGQAAAEAHQYFQCLWSTGELQPANVCKRRRRDPSECSPMRYISQQISCASLHPGLALDLALSDLTARGFLRPDLSFDWSACPDRGRVRFLRDHAGRKHQANAITEQINELVASAQSSIILESPYLVVCPHFEQAIKQAQARGAHVVILTNSLATTDELLVYAGYSNQKQKLLARGIELWEFAGPDRFHAKSALIDGCISVIGSYNFDPRSEHLNTETAVVAHDPGVAAELSATMAEHFANAWRIGPDGKPVHTKVRHPGAEQSKICKLRGARLAAPFIKRHL